MADPKSNMSDGVRLGMLIGQTVQTVTTRVRNELEASKADKVHVHTISDVEGLTEALDVANFVSEFPIGDKNNANTTFALSYSPILNEKLRLYLNGVQYFNTPAHTVFTVDPVSKLIVVDFTPFFIKLDDELLIEYYTKDELTSVS